MRKRGTRGDNRGRGRDPDANAGPETASKPNAPIDRHRPATGMKHRELGVRHVAFTTHHAQPSHVLRHRATWHAGEARRHGGLLQRVVWRHEVHACRGHVNRASRLEAARQLRGHHASGEAPRELLRSWETAGKLGGPLAGAQLCLQRVEHGGGELLRVGCPGRQDWLPNFVEDLLGDVSTREGLQLRGVG